MSVSKVLGAVRQGDNDLDEVKLLLSEYQNELPEKQLDRCGVSMETAVHES